MSPQLNTVDQISRMSECRQFGHLPPEVEHLPDHVTRITCPRCKKSVRERGLSDHPDAARDAA